MLIENETLTCLQIDPLTLFHIDATTSIFLHNQQRLDWNKSLTY